MKTGIVNNAIDIEELEYTRKCPFICTLHSGAFYFSTLSSIGHF
jgi:hypothetical protein